MLWFAILRLQAIRIGNRLFLIAAMLKAISTHIFLNNRLHTGHLDALAKGGAEAIEVFAARHHFDYTSRSQVREIADWFRSNATKAWSLHAPLRSEADRENERGGEPLNVVHFEKARRIEAMDEIKRAMEAAEQIPFSNLILHLGERNTAWDQHSLEYALTAVEHLRAFARPLGMRILLENLEKNDVARPDKLIEILTTGHFDDCGTCLDMGHANIDSNVLDAITAMGERIRSVHVHDNMGDKDTHLWPGDGTIPWQEAMSALAALPSPPASVLEIQRASEGSTETVIEHLQRTWDLLETAAR